MWNMPTHWREPPHLGPLPDKQAAAQGELIVDGEGRRHDDPPVRQAPLRRAALRARQRLRLNRRTEPD
jgi:hypothetical protein